MKSYVKELPCDYREAFHINAKNKTTGIKFNLAAFIILGIVMGVGCLFLIGQDKSYSLNLVEIMLLYGAFIIAMIMYIILHELVHGIAYKLMTRKKLTFGIGWSCAFCGVPDIYVYRRVAIIALIAPLITFTVLLLPLTILLYFVHPVYYIASLYILGMHLGGCVGDGYMTYLFIFRYKKPDTLIRDKGPEQYIYITDTNGHESEV